MDMIVETEIGLVAANLGKSENSRIAAGQQFKRIVDYVRDPDTDGAQQIIALGYEPTVAGVWHAVKTNKHYPLTLGKSFSTGKRLLQIGRADDLEAAAQRERDRQNAEPARSGFCKVSSRQRDETLQEDFDPVEEDQFIGTVPSTDVIEPEPDPLHSNTLRRAKLTREQHEQDLRNSHAEAKQNGMTRKQAHALVDDVYGKEAPVERPVVVPDRVKRAVDLFFACNKQLWLRQRMADPQPTTFKPGMAGPHIDWITTFWNGPAAEQQAIKEAIEIETSKRAA